jgi:uncharacterized protein YdeI (YjbR/CyaY-like superfamily)
MGTRDPRVDAYIAKSADFARPILAHVREIVHTACPDVEETMKWSTPNFMYHGMLCSMASFKAHCAVGFWKGALVTGESEKAQEAAGSYGRLTSVKDLPPKKTIIAHIKKAMALNEQGVKTPRVKHAKPDLETPEYFTAAVKKNKRAHAAFEKFPPSHKREYVEWITEAKTEATRQRRIAQAIEWMAEGKSRNWKYE